MRTKLANWIKLVIAGVILGAAVLLSRYSPQVLGAAMYIYGKSVNPACIIVGDASVKPPPFWWVHETTNRTSVLIARVPPLNKDGIPMVAIFEETEEELCARVSADGWIGEECANPQYSTRRYVRISKTKEGGHLDYLWVMPSIRIGAIALSYHEDDLKFAMEIINHLSSVKEVQCND